MVIRRSLPRFEEMPDGRFELTIGCPMDMESTCDTTGSMGDNVQTMIEVLPETYGVISEVLPGYDLQLALGIFGDMVDRFIVNRPQFEMTAEKIVDYVTKLVPESNGGDIHEDPQYAIFGAAYLTDTFTNRIGLKGYHFMITDAPMHRYRLDPDLIERVYGEDVWKNLADNGHSDITRTNLPDIDDMFKALHKRAHAFVIGLGGATSYFSTYYDVRHRINIHDTRCLPAIEAAVIGLTEGTLQPMDLRKFLKDHQVSNANIDRAMPGLSQVELSAQRKLEQAAKIVIPKKGDIFAKKTDKQPVDASALPDVPVLKAPKEPDKPKKSTWI
ncbi:hypothetical protein IJM16_03405 [Candidatus Saccharibacteria bacterium]|nr:hypothetical protein [Candidatus Saccharibacteria bacterium]